MKKLQSFIGLLLCTVLAFTLLSGCSESGGSSSTDSTLAPTETTPASTDVALKPTDNEPQVISWLCTNSATLVYDFENMAWVQEILKKANVELEMELVDGSVYNDTVMPRLAAGVNLPDVIQLPSLDSDMAYINSGVFIDLTELYDEHAVYLEDRFMDNPTVKGQITTPDGKIYYVPVINLSVDYAIAISMNVEWLSELRSGYPTTTDEYYETLKAFKGHDFNGNGEDDEIPLFLCPNFINFFATTWGLDLSRGYVVEEDGVVRCSYTSERYKDYLEYFNKLYSEGLLYNEFATSTYDIQNSLISQNRIGSVQHYHVNNLSYSQLINPDFDIENDKLIFSPIEPLTGPYGDKYKFYWGNDPIAGFFGITRDCENPEETFQFLDYLYSKEANDLLYFGIEDVDYVVDGDNYIIDLEKRSTDNYANRMGNNFGGFPRILLAIHRDLSYTPETAANNQQLREYYRLPLCTSFFLENELDVIQEYGADLSTYWSEAHIAFITGTKDISEFDDYVNVLKSMHVEDVEAVYQAKYDRASN